MAGDTLKHTFKQLPVTNADLFSTHTIPETCHTDKHV